MTWVREGVEFILASSICDVSLTTSGEPAEVDVVIADGL